VDPDALTSRHVGHEPGDGEAALQVSILTRRAHDAGVDELVELALDLDDADRQRLSELGRGQPDPGRVAHRVGEVVKQLVKRLAEAVDRLAPEAQPRIAERHDRANGHGGEYRTASRPRSEQ